MRAAFLRKRSDLHMAIRLACMEAGIQRMRCAGDTEDPQCDYMYSSAGCDPFFARRDLSQNPIGDNKSRKRNEEKLLVTKGIGLHLGYRWGEDASGRGSSSTSQRHLKTGENRLREGLCCFRLPLCSNYFILLAFWAGGCNVADAVEGGPSSRWTREKQHE